jgi:hypothetical protein
MTQPTKLLPNLYAFNVPMDAMKFTIDMGYIIWKTVDKSNWVTDKEIEADARRFLRTGKSRFGGAEEGMKYLTGGMPLPPGNWSIICCSKTATEEDAAKVVERDFFDEDWEDKKGYIHYEDGRLICDSTIDSLRSLLRSKNCDPSLNWLILKLEQ